ncbi:efflux RND transporter periplasmic adaptor subunit [Dyadobacter tibetensis]|uniref:efflux RND transporter periplasmic adaptor subunit n=1 Tax=Dyadobacter tibetensis TaxID=1211851 RepID=UPI0004717614|nr:efflux RND transporter periplasmic adaptor subunit [Dyadobacter tibetensis]
MLPQIKLIASSTILITALWSCGQKEQQKPTAPQEVPVTLMEVTNETTTYFDQYPGTVVPLNEIELRPQVSGFITGIHFKDGAKVKKGQLLYSIDAQLYSANYDQAVAALQVQEANMLKAQKDADRYQALAKNDAVATQLVDNAEAALQVAKKQVEAAKANIKAVQTNVRYTKVYAPFSGTIGISQVKPGSPVSAGQTLLNTVSTDQQLAVDFNVDQKEIYRFTNLIKENKKSDSTFTLAFGQEIYPYPGKIDLLDRAVDPQTGTIRARLTFPNPDNALRAGMTGNVRVRSVSGASAVSIPFKAVTEQLGEYFVYVLGDSSKVTQRRIEPGRTVGSKIIVEKGLNAGEKIAVEGIQNLREGVKVTTASPQAAPGAGNK